MGGVVHVTEGPSAESAALRPRRARKLCCLEAPARALSPTVERRAAGKGVADNFR
jgi:hypothetical protein